MGSVGGRVFVLDVTKGLKRRTFYNIGTYLDYVPMKSSFTGFPLLPCCPLVTPTAKTHIPRNAEIGTRKEGNTMIRDAVFKSRQCPQTPHRPSASELI